MGINDLHTGDPMTDPKKKLEQMSDFGDTVGINLGNFIRGTFKYITAILLIVLVGTAIFITSMIRGTIRKKENKYADL